MCSRVFVQSYRYSRGDDRGGLDWMAVQTKPSVESGQEVEFPSCPVSIYIVVLRQFADLAAGETLSHVPSERKDQWYLADCQADLNLATYTVPHFFEA